MEPVAIATAVTAFIAPFLPHLLKPAEAAFTEAVKQIGKSLGEGSIASAKKLFGLVQDKVTEGGPAAAALSAAAPAADATDPAAWEAFSAVLARVLQDDPTLAARLADEIAVARATETPAAFNISQQVAKYIANISVANNSHFGDSYGARPHAS